jgi:hypothetical protein
VLFSLTVHRTEAWQGGGFHIGTPAVILSAAISVSAIPITYRTLHVPPSTPMAVQFLMFVENGVFWQVITEFIGRAAVSLK